MRVGRKGMLRGVRDCDGIACIDSERVWVYVCTNACMEIVCMYVGRYVRMIMRGYSERV